MNIVKDQRLNHRLEVTSGLLADQAGELLKHFFQRKRSFQ
jgi:tRNA(adenine34) deaminase